MMKLFCAKIYFECAIFIMPNSEGLIRVSQGYSILFLNEIQIRCYSSSELSWRTVLTRGNNICFYGEIWKILSKFSKLPSLIWTTSG